MEHLLKQAIKLRNEKKYAQSKEMLIGLTNLQRMQKYCISVRGYMM